ncbi:hypothetical protein [Paenibacillus apiarius]|uniref:hypothetical protein n=1 Tax=Paenibacillus apiarius TaxID=46240 RepID=UPI003B3ABFE1
MAEQTPNLKLTKPSENDAYDISIVNDNLDKIDVAVQGVKDDISNIDLSKITPESIGAETPTGAQEKANAAAAASVPVNGAVNKHGFMNVIADGQTIGLMGSTTSFMGFYPTGTSTRAGYIGASRPNEPSAVVLAADAGILALYGTGIYLNNRDVVSELDQLKQSVVDGKGKVAGAINDKGGGPVSANSTFDQLAAAITGMQEAAGDLNISSTFLDSYNSRTTYINKENNFIFYNDNRLNTSPVTVQPELHEVTPSGTVVQTVSLGPAIDTDSSGVYTVGEGVVLFGSKDAAGNYYYNIYNHNGTQLMKNAISYLNWIYARAICMDGANIFIALAGNPVKITSATGTVYFAMPDGSGSGYELLFLSKTKLFVAREDNSPIGRRMSIITRNGTSFSHASAQQSVGFGQVMSFLAAHAYR